MKIKPNLSCLLAGALLVWLPGAGAQTPQAADNFVAVVVKVVPSVQLIHGVDQKSVPLQKDTRLYPGDQIICGDKGYVSLIFADNAVEQKLYPNTTITLQGQRGKTDVTKRIFLSIGRVLTRVLHGDMEIITPTSVASVKGTKWWTQVDTSNQTQIIVLEGNVKMQNRATGVEKIISAGNTAITTQAGGIQVTPSLDDEIPDESQSQDQGSLEIEFQDDSGSTRMLHIDFDR
ncbi:MAG: FecR domain-containing protein [bacterium]|nr:FecR domain-containing protein [bacterium]